MAKSEPKACGEKLKPTEAGAIPATRRTTLQRRIASLESGGGRYCYRSKSNETWLKAHGRVSRVHRKKPNGKPRSEALRTANRVKSKIRARVEHVFAQQKAHMALFIRTIGIKRAEAKITLANLAYDMQRLIFHERGAAAG